MFGEECVDFKDKNCLAVSVDEKTAYINLETRVSIRLLLLWRLKYWDSNVFVMFVFRPWSMKKLILKMILSEKWWSSLCRGCMKPWTLSCEIANSHLPSSSLKNFCYYSPSHLNNLNQTEDSTPDFGLAKALQRIELLLKLNGYQLKMDVDTCIQESLFCNSTS